MTYKELLRSIRNAREVYVYSQVYEDAGCYIRAYKNDLIQSLKSNEDCYIDDMDWAVFIEEGRLFIG